MQIQKYTGEHTVTKMCEAMEVSRSGYYRWLRRAESPRAESNAALVTRINEIHADKKKKVYGSPRMTEELRAEGYVCNHKRVAALMQKHGIQAKRRRKYRVTTDSKHGYPIAENLLSQEFIVTEPDTVYLSDVTYIWTREGWMYLAVVLDLCTRLVVGYATSRKHNSDLAQTALRRAITARKPAPGLIHHSDRGGEYAALGYQALLHSHGMIPSMSRKGNCWDNAPMESFFATIKKEMIYLERFETVAHTEMRIFDYIECFYNTTRRHSKLGYLSPREYEQKINQRTTNPPYQPVHVLG
jgi:putative transposase